MHTHHLSEWSQDRTFDEGRLLLNRIGPLAKALEVDPAHLLRLTMLEYMPETWESIESVLQSTLLTANELDFIRAYRAAIHVTISKTKHSTGKKVVYEWSPELRQAVGDAKSIHPALSPYLFCNRFGKCYVNLEKGTVSSGNNHWQNCMNRVLKDTKVTESFTEHDLRAKVGSDAESLERARQLLAHSDARVTERVYRRKPEGIKPVK